MIARPLARGKRCINPGAIHDEDGGPAVIVVVEDSYAGAGCFDDVLFGIHSAKNFLHGEAGFFGHICEVGNGVLWKGFRGLNLLAEARHGAKKNESGEQYLACAARTERTGTFEWHGLARMVGLQEDPVKPQPEPRCGTSALSPLLLRPGIS